MRDGEWKLLLASDRARRSLFHLGRDRGEQRDLAQEEPQVAETRVRATAELRDQKQAQLNPSDEQRGG